MYSQKHHINTVRFSSPENTAILKTDAYEQTWNVRKSFNEDSTRYTIRWNMFTGDHASEHWRRVTREKELASITKSSIIHRTSITRFLTASTSSAAWVSWKLWIQGPTQVARLWIEETYATSRELGCPPSSGRQYSLRCDTIATQFGIFQSLLSRQDPPPPIFCLARKGLRIRYDGFRQKHLSIVVSSYPPYTLSSQRSRMNSDERATLGHLQECQEIGQQGGNTPVQQWPLCSKHRDIHIGNRNLSFWPTTHRQTKQTLDPKSQHNATFQTLHDAPVARIDSIPWDFVLWLFSTCRWHSRVPTIESWIVSLTNSARHVLPSMLCVLPLTGSDLCLRRCADIVMRLIFRETTQYRQHNREISRRRKHQQKWTKNQDRGLCLVSPSAATQRSSPAHDLRHWPKITKNGCDCHMSCQLVCDARTCDDRYATAAQQLDHEVEGAEELGPGNAFRKEQPLSTQNSLPGQWRRRRENLVVVKNIKKHLNATNLCLDTTDWQRLSHDDQSGLLYHSGAICFDSWRRKKTYWEMNGRHSKFVILDVHHACKGHIHGLIRHLQQ